MTPSSAPTPPITLSAETATTSLTATRAPTSRSWVPVTTPSSGTVATAPTSSRATGTDTMLFNGAAGPEHVDISNDGAGRLRFFRTEGNITMDNNDVEVIQFNALGGADNVVVHNLA